ncbi:MAG TPA: hypothetical protein VMH22_09085 [bacterium]|nr:hypothetical protein [bacterium]
MVRRIVAALAGLLAIILMNCDTKTLNYPPKLNVVHAVSDAALVISVVPDTVYVSKNGHRTFDLAAIVRDTVDKNTPIAWSLSPGPLITVDLNSSMADVGPVPNQVCTSYVVFTATDAMGASNSKTCVVSVFDEFGVTAGADTIVVNTNDSAYVDITCKYRPILASLLAWGDTILCDTAKLRPCSWSGSPESGGIKVRAKGGICTTAVQFFVHDPVNHVDFTHSVPVRVR